MKRTPLKRKASLGRVYERKGKLLTCEGCGEQFYARPQEVARGRKFCSRTCMGVVSRVQRTCSICGNDFESPAYRHRKTCSPLCSRKARGRAKTGANNPNFKDGNTSNVLWRAAMEPACRRCGSRGRRQLHHVVYEQHLRARGLPLTDPRNALTLCVSCHQAHHHAIDRRIAVSQLRPENVAYAVEVLGEAAVYYFPRYYDYDAPERLVEALSAL